MTKQSIIIDSLSEWVNALHDAIIQRTVRERCGNLHHTPLTLGQKRAKAKAHAKRKAQRRARKANRP